jgi:hypothetical protein
MNAELDSPKRDFLNAEELWTQFENCTLPPSQFSHRLHLQMGWRCLRQHGFPQGVVEFEKRLRAYVESVGASAKFHQTVTWAYMVLMNEEMTCRSAPDEPFETMIERRSDLLDHRSGALAQCYPREQLESSAAQRVFMLPRQLGGAGS